MACSLDGGLNWTTNLTAFAKTGGDFPKLSVGPDGSFLVAYGVFNLPTYSLNVQKWSSCASGFNPTGKQLQVVKTVTEVTDMPGLDRNPGGNYSPAFDDSDGSGQRIFVVYSNEATAGNDDVHVAESTDGGATWARDSIVSTVSTGRRYFPWICSTVGKKFVTWYDRRNSTAASPDLTAYYRSSVFDNGTPASVGIGTETNVSGVDDPQCSPGFFGSVRGAIEESGCTNLPAGFIQGGQCQTATCALGKTPPCGTLNACDFRAATPCPTPVGSPPETCTIIANAGIPKTTTAPAARWGRCSRPGPRPPLPRALPAWWSACLPPVPRSAAPETHQVERARQLRPHVRPMVALVEAPSPHAAAPALTDNARRESACQRSPCTPGRPTSSLAPGPAGNHHLSPDRGLQRLRGR